MNDNSKTQIINTITKQGAWAVVACSVLGYFGWQGNKLVDGAGAAVAAYIAASSESIAHIEDAVTSLSRSTITLQQALESNADVLQINRELIQRNGDAVEISQQNITRIISLMEEAQETMKGVPAQRQELIEIMQQLLDETRKNKNEHFPSPLEEK